MNRYFLIIVVALVVLLSCRKGATGAESTQVDSTAVVVDTLVADTVGVDTTLLND